MAKKKEQWKPMVNCFLKDMTQISPENISVPENHLVYRILTKINQERLQHDRKHYQRNRGSRIHRLPLGFECHLRDEKTGA